MSVYNVQRYDFSDIIDDDNRKLILIIYDIVDNKRRLAMVKLLESYAGECRSLPLRLYLQTECTAR